MRKLLFSLAVTLGIAATPIAHAGAWEEILQAAEANDTATVADLINRGMDPNTSDQTGTTLLMIAARNGNDKLLELLLRDRANTMIRNKYGDSALTLAAISGHLDAVKQLVEYGVPLTAAGEVWSALQYAAFAGNDGIVSYLLAKGAPVDAPAPNGQTPLMLAAAEGHKATVELLIKAGADRSATDRDGRSALDIAESNEQEDVAKVLRQAEEAPAK